MQRCCRWSVSKQIANIYKALRVLRKEGYRVSKSGLKDRYEYNSFTYNQSGFRLISKDNRWYLWLSKIGYIRIRLHREIAGNNNIKQVTVKRKNGRWYTVFTVERAYPIFRFIDVNKRIVMAVVDPGVKHFILDSNGNRVERPEPSKRLIRRLRLMQRRPSRRKKGGKNCRKAERWYKILHERIERKR